MRINYKALLILSIIIIIYIELQGANPTFDDANYVAYAHQILNGKFNYTESPYALGFVYPYPIAASLKVFGNSNLAGGVPNMIYFAILLLLIFEILKTYNEEKIAFAVSIMALTSAFIAGYSSRATPDMLAGVLVALGIYCIIKLKDNKIGFYLGGLSLGSIIFVKLGSFAIIGIFLLAILIVQKKLEKIAFIVGALFPILLYLCLINFNLGLFSAYSANQIALSMTSLTTNFIESFIYAMPFLYYQGNQGQFWQVFPIGLIFDLAFVSIYYLFLKREHQLDLYSLILIIGFIYFMFGTQSLSSYIPITIVSRYFVLLAVPMAILTAKFMTAIYKLISIRSSNRAATMAIITIVLLSIMLNMPMLYFFHIHPSVSYIGAPISNTTIINVST